MKRNSFPWGLIVDRVAEVLTLDADQIVPPPGVWAKLGRSYLSGIGKVEGRVNLLLDCEKLFTESEAREIGASTDNAGAPNA